MEALRIHVERIVRPIRASVRRKNAMREELLAHLEQRVEDALGEGMSEFDAVAFATKNLGEPDHLRAELEESVPRVERLLFARIPGVILDGWFDKRDDQSSLRYAWVRAVYTVLFAAVIFVPAFALPFFGVNEGATLFRLLGGQRSDRGDWLFFLYTWPLVVLAAIGLSSLIAYYAADVLGIRKALSKQHEISLVRRVVFLNLFIETWLLLFWATSAVMALSLYPSLWEVPRVLPALVALSPEVVGIQVLLCFFMSPFAGWAIGKEHQHYERWDKLILHK